MKKFFVRIGILFGVIAILDFMVGVIGTVLVNNAKGGYTKRQTYISNEVNSEILIFGSSRAIHHYDPDIFEDILGMTTYNCGFDGSGIICAYGYVKMIEKRYWPKIIIYEITPEYDLLPLDNHASLEPLKYFYDNDGVDSIFWAVDKTERYKMISHMYRYNYPLPQLVLDNISPHHTYNKGYNPLDDNEFYGGQENAEQMGYKYDSLKLFYIEKLIKDCNRKTTLIFTVSPFYKRTSDIVLEPIQVLCDKYGVPLISHYTDSAFNDREDYFFDASHLNRRGATKYSKVVAGEIKQLMEQQ